MIDSIHMSAALPTFNSLVAANRNDDARRYRDDIIALYINAMDAHYDLFRRKLNGQRKGAGLGLSLAALGLGNAVPLVGDGGKDVLGVLAGAATGTRTAVDKELYFDQALPALLAAMDAERTKVKATLIEGMGKPATDYSLARAFIDLNAYQAAPSFERAIDKLTAAANADRQEADTKLENAVAGCNTDEDLAPARGRIVDVLFRDGLTAAQLNRMALRVDADTKRNGVALDVESQREAIRDRLLVASCDSASLNLIADDFTSYAAPTAGGGQ